MRRPTVAHLQLLACAAEGLSLPAAAHRMHRTTASIDRLYRQLVDAGLVQHMAPDEDLQITGLGRAVMRGGLFKTKKRPPASGGQTAT